VSPVIPPTITTVIATHTNIEFSAWFRNVFSDFTIGIFPITLRHLERGARSSGLARHRIAPESFLIADGEWFRPLPYQRFLRFVIEYPIMVLPRGHSRR
jgi:hypothetical protein